MYIRRQTFRDGKVALYVQLFEAIKKQRTYDEPALLKQFANVNLGASKFNLIEQILRSLISNRVIRNSFSNVNDEAQYRILKVETLASKGIYDLALKYIVKGLDFCDQNELFEHWIKLHRIRQEIYTHLQDLRKLSEIAFEREVKNRRMAMMNLMQDQDIFYGFYPKAKRLVMARGKPDLEMINQLKLHQLLSSEQYALSKRAKLIFYRLWYIIYLFEGKLDLCFNAAKMQYDLYTSHEFLAEENPYDAISAAANLCDLLIKAHKFEEAEKTMTWTDRLLPTITRPNSDPLQAFLFERKVLSVINLSCHSQDHTFFETKWKWIENSIGQHKLFLRPGFRITYFFGVAVLYFQAADHSNDLASRVNLLEKAGRFLNKLENWTGKGIRIDIQIAGRLMALCSWFERGEYRLLEGKEPQYRRFISSLERMFPIERALLGFFRLEALNFDILTQPEKLKALKKLRIAIDCGNNPLDCRILEYCFHSKNGQTEGLRMHCRKPIRKCLPGSEWLFLHPTKLPRFAIL